ncbi:hypothetical protein Nepgr_005505 [Nepenthes gracilis]|uniref:Uncharacterized protein n=1 Tax=Nepenthes gracilis TaxID=150966 RepID=A0AAD3S3M3_NEPGR|nr:hypothetical protein Nepgr_005505 [Nepenthes gracilis]
MQQSGHSSLRILLFEESVSFCLRAVIAWANQQMMHNIFRTRGVNDKEGYGSSQCPNRPFQNATYPQPTENHHAAEEEDKDGGLGEEKDEENRMHGVMMVGKYDYNDEDDDNMEDDEDNVEQDGVNYSQSGENVVDQPHPKKRKLENLILNYHFAACVPAPSASAPSRPPFVGP